MRVQDALTRAWMSQTPLQKLSPANMASSILIRELGPSLPSYTFIDFCAGGGGPTPALERSINAHLRDQKKPPVDFVLTDLHPNIEAWERIAAENPRITYEREGVDASCAPERLVRRGDGKRVIRLFNLAFHHFDDSLATEILKDTVETSQGFAIFELQDRSFASAITHLMFGIGIMALAPLYAWKWRSPATLFFTWFIPILPFVLVFDGYISSLRTRTPDEVEVLLRSCGANTSQWELRSGRERHLWPCGYLNWIICKPVERAS